MSNQQQHQPKRKFTSELCSHCCIVVYVAKKCNYKIVNISRGVVGNILGWVGDSDSNIALGSRKRAWSKLFLFFFLFFFDDFLGSKMNPLPFQQLSAPNDYTLVQHNVQRVYGLHCVFIWIMCQASIEIGYWNVSTRKKSFLVFILLNASSIVFWTLFSFWKLRTAMREWKELKIF